ncbi:MAG: hypothetical protein JJU33_12705 [Phycisphaerales bacterium]|nr:hypothetical protein [Phycisphaerales bacterium]
MRFMMLIVMALPLISQFGCVHRCDENVLSQRGVVPDTMRIVIDRIDRAKVSADNRYVEPPRHSKDPGRVEPCVTLSGPGGTAALETRHLESFVREWHRYGAVKYPRGSARYARLDASDASLAEAAKRNPQSTNGDHLIPMTAVLVSARPYAIAVVDRPRVGPSFGRDRSRLDFRWSGPGSSFDVISLELPHTVTLGTELPLADTVSFYIDDRPRTITTLNAPSEPGAFTVLHDGRGRAILRLHREATLLRVGPAEPSDDKI